MPSPPANVRRDPLAVTEPKRHEVSGLVLLSTGVLHALSLASWNVSGGDDWVGPIGARVAEVSIAFLGTASVLVPWCAVVVSVRLFRRTVRPVRPLRALGTAGIVVTVATGLHLGWGDQPALGGLPAGGLVGDTLGEFLRATVGTAGSFTVVITVLLVALVVRTRLSVVTVASNARDASVKGGVLARDGFVMLARAWRQARNLDTHDAPKRAATASRGPRPEELTAKALRPVLDAPPPPDSDHGRDSDPGREVSPSDANTSDAGHDALAAALTRSATDSEPRPAPRRARRRPTDSAPEMPAALVTPPSVVAPAPEPVIVAPEAAAPVLRVPERPAPAVKAPAPAPVAKAPAVPSEPDLHTSATRTAPDAAPPSMPRVKAPVSAPPSEVSVDDDPPFDVDVAPAPQPTARAPKTAPVVRESAPVVRESAPVVRESAPVVREPVPARTVATPSAAFIDDDLDDDDDDDAPVSRPPPRASKPAARREPEAPAVESGPLNIISHHHEIEAAKKRTDHIAADPIPPVVPNGAEMEMPSIDLLAAPPPSGVQFDEAHLRATAERLVQTLADYTIEGRVMEVHPGPVVTTFEVVPAAGTKLSKIARLSDDIAMSLEASKVRIVAPIPGKGRVGFEVPNAKRQMVYLRELIETEAFQKLGGALPVAIGKDVVGAPYFADLATMPHLIVAGATGQGKSVGLNVMLASLLYKRGPEDVRMLMVDPKMVELAVYDNIPHMLLPVVTDMKKAALALRWVVDEMERRYSLFAQTGSRNITTYNERVAKAVSEGRSLRGLDGPVRTKETGTTVEIKAGEGESHDVALAKAGSAQPRKLPYIVVVVDEFADLIMVAGKDIEAAVARLAQKARAAGIHVILATQRPSVDVITGMIKANFPARIAFKVSQKLDSRVILDQQGAEHLLGKGDMLILPPGSSDLRRVHCAFVNEDEVQRITDHWREQGKPVYDEEILKPREEEESGGDDGPAEIKVPQEKYEKAVALVLSQRKCSVSFVQRYLGIGYNVAARIVDKMEREGIVGAPKGPGKDREVLG